LPFFRTGRVLGENKGRSFVCRNMSAAAKLESPSSERNKLPIWENVFVPHLLAQSEDSEGQRTLRVLEVAAGSGVHTQFFGQQLAGKNVSVTWQSTDPEDSALASQEAYIREMVPDDAASSSTTASPPWTCGSVTFLAPLPLTLDTAGICQPETDEAIAAESIDWVYNINMIHISPWSATVGLMRMAGRKLKPSGKMFLYGPYRVNGTCVESNV
jgi:SAM-dependent methyltransferase